MGKAEFHVEGYLVRRIKALSGLCLKFVSPGHSGVPDRVVILAGKTVFVETKAPGGEPRPLQRVQIGRMIAAGADVRVIDTRKQVDELLEELLLVNEPALEEVLS